MYQARAKISPFQNQTRLQSTTRPTSDRLLGRRLVPAIIVGNILFAGCKESSQSDNGTTTPTESTTEKQQQNNGQTGTLAIELPTSPASIMAFLDKSVTSSITTPSTAALNPGALAIATQLNLADFTGQPCTSYAFPKDVSVATDTSWATYSPDFAAGRFFCLLAKNTYAPNSVQGAYYQDKGFLCLLEKSGLAFDGQSRSMDLDFSDPGCFSDEFRQYSFEDGVPPPFPVTVVASSPSAIAPDVWDKSVVISFPNNEGTFQMVFKSTSTKISSAVYLEAGGPPGSAYAMTLDAQSGVLQIERRGISNKNGNLTQRAFRLMVRGTVEKGGVFKSVESYEGIDADVYSQSGQLSSTFHSIRGMDTKGYRTSTRICANCADIYDPASYQSNSASTECYPGNDGVKSCTDITPILFDTAEALKFIPDQSRQDSLPLFDWIKRGPLNYADVKAVPMQ